MVRAVCAGPSCTADVVAVPAHAHRALCIECGREAQGIRWEWFKPFGELHPNTGYPAPGQGPSAEPVPSPDPAPVPIITAAQTYAAGWDQWPNMVTLVERKARKAGWDVRIGFSRGWKPGNGEHAEPVLIDVIGLCVARPGVAGSIMWSRLVDGSYAWVAAGAWYRSLGRTAVMGHTEAKRRLLL